MLFCQCKLIIIHFVKETHTNSELEPVDFSLDYGHTYGHKYFTVRSENNNCSHQKYRH